MKLRLSLLVVVSALALLITSPGGITQFQAQTTKSKVTPCCGPVHPVAPRELDFPYYSLADGFTSTLYLVSDSPIPIPLTVTVRKLAGQAVFSSPTIQPHQKLPIDLRGVILEAGEDPTSNFAEGSVSGYYQGTIMPVVG
jgi:hypothetical protein